MYSAWHEVYLPLAGFVESVETLSHVLSGLSMPGPLQVCPLSPRQHSQAPATFQPLNRQLW
jgi:hypothetical protein